MQRNRKPYAAVRRAVRASLETLEQRALFSVAADLFAQPLGGPARLFDSRGDLDVQPLTSAEPLGPTASHHHRHPAVATAPGYCQPDLRFLTRDGARPAGSSTPFGYAPDDIRGAYGFDRLTFEGGSVRGDGSGQTVAIIDAFDDPNIEADLATFDRAFGLPGAHFAKVNQDGGTAYPVANAGWAGEIALDVEWAHALAPGANILLVEATDNSYDNLMAAVDFARRQAGVSVVSMSWGSGEFASETAYDDTFTTPAGHQGVTFLASTGDDGAPCQYPACSPNVVAVGGTSLYPNGQGGYGTEIGWSGSGGGVSQYELRPAYQAGVNGGAYRSGPDVAFDADPYTGVAVCDSFGNGPVAPWVRYGGTSFSAPAWASLVAILNQGRSMSGQGSMCRARARWTARRKPSPRFTRLRRGTSTT
jgi:subtilase family serine protease